MFVSVYVQPSESVIGLIPHRSVLCFRFRPFVFLAVPIVTLAVFTDCPQNTEADPGFPVGGGADPLP